MLISAVEVAGAALVDVLFVDVVFFDAVFLGVCGDAAPEAVEDSVDEPAEDPLSCDPSLSTIPAIRAASTRGADVGFARVRGLLYDFGGHPEDGALEGDAVDCYCGRAVVGGSGCGATTTTAGRGRGLIR